MRSERLRLHRVTIQIPSDDRGRRAAFIFLQVGKIRLTLRWRYPVLRLDQVAFVVGRSFSLVLSFYAPLLISPFLPWQHFWKMKHGFSEARLTRRNTDFARSTFCDDDQVTGAIVIHQPH